MSIRWILACVLAVAGSAHAAQVYDLGAETPPVLPTTVGTGQSVYFTNTTDADASVAADSLAIDRNAAFHLGYGPAVPALGGTALSITGSMLVQGSAAIGSPATTAGITMDMESLAVDGGTMNIYAGSPDAATDVTVRQDLSVNGGSLSLTGTGSGAGGEGEGGGSGTTSLSARTVAVHNGRVTVGPASSITTTLDAAPGSTGTPQYAVTIGAGGRIVVNSGLPADAPPATDPEEPPAETAGVAGLDVTAGGDGIRVGAYGVLAAGASGGIIAGQAGDPADPENPGVPTASGQRLVVDHQGVLDASAGGLSVTGMGVRLDGTYMAGYTAATGTINRLTADSAVEFGQTGTIALSKDLQRAMNRMEYHTQGDSTILSGAAITFANGIPVIRSAMGDYYLDLGAGVDDGMDHLWVRRVENGVLGTGEAGDRGVFAGNFGRVWNNRFVSPEFANAVYDVSAREAPIAPTGEAGLMNQAAFDAFVAGPGSAIGDHGVADDAVLEFYIGGSQFGPAAVAVSTATELSHAMYSRINQVATEQYRFGSVGSGSAYAFYDPAVEYCNRLWVGGFGRREEADLDYGIAGFTYKPSGVVLGYDTLRGPFVLGAALAYGRGNYEDKIASANDSKITSYSAGVYSGIHYQNGLIATAHASYTRMDNDMEDVRGGMRRTADYSADVWSLGARVAYETNPAERLTLTPSIGLSRTEVRQSDHSERLDGLSVMRVDKLRRRSTLLPVDIALTWDVFCSGSSLFKLGANFGYAYEFDNDGLTGDLDYFGLPGVAPVPTAERQPGRNRFNFGAGFFYSGSKFDLSGKYDYYTRTNHHAHQFKGALGVKF